jgi:hypothetical protein
MATDPWMIATRRGDFGAAWRISDAVLRERQLRRTDCSHWPRHLQYIWDGTPIEGQRVLVRCYHGLGDTIQFARLMEPLRQRARSVTLWAQPALLDLLSTVHGIDRLLPLHDGAPGTDFDVDIELMEVAHALRIDLANLPPRLPYIYVRADTPTEPELPSSTLNVGIAWRSGDWDTSRSIPTSALAQFAGLHNVNFYSLQFPAEELAFSAGNLARKDIATMARAITRLDVVISVDTMVAHLAGALAAPTWTLLSERADWRWMDAGSSSPWYPTMRLFRKQDSSWDSVLDEVVVELAALARPERQIAARKA